MSHDARSEPGYAITAELVLAFRLEFRDVGRRCLQR